MNTKPTVTAADLCTLLGIEPTKNQKAALSSQLRERGVYVVSRGRNAHYEVNRKLLEAMKSIRYLRHLMLRWRVPDKGFDSIDKFIRWGEEVVMEDDGPGDLSLTGNDSDSDVKEAEEQEPEDKAFSLSGLTNRSLRKRVAALEELVERIEVERLGNQIDSIENALGRVSNLSASISALAVRVRAAEIPAKQFQDLAAEVSELKNRRDDAERHIDGVHRMVNVALKNMRKEIRELRKSPEKPEDTEKLVARIKALEDDQKKLEAGLRRVHMSTLFPL